jgi:glycosyltransferase involved in cell wall biosynthesis
MNIVAYVHTYPPERNAGAEWMLHTMLKAMVDRGHKAKVLIDFELNKIKKDYKTRNGRNNKYTFQGVDVYDYRYFASEVFQTADIIITHLEKGSDSMNGAPRWAKKFQRPLVRVVHNERELHVYKATKENTDLLIFNSEWIRKAYNATLTEGWEQIVLVPPVDVDHYKVDRKNADKITLINLNDNKGAYLFYNLARAMKDKQFLGVKGGYDRQMIASGSNITIEENMADIRPAYAQTRILLVPSLIETWGRVAIEAMCSGIPVIANETAGLREACGDAAIFLDRNKPEDWIAEINKLDDPKYYEKRSKLALKRAEELRPSYDEFEQALIDTIKNYKPKDMYTRKNNMPIATGETVKVIALRNFRHKEVHYSAGEVEVPKSDLGFLLGRVLIKTIDKPVRKEKVEVKDEGVLVAKLDKTEKEVKPEELTMVRSKKTKE